MGSKIPQDIEKFVLAEPANYVWFPVEESKKTDTKNLIILDPNVVFEGFVDSSTVFIYADFCEAKAQTYIPVTSFWNEDRMYKSMDEDILKTPAILKFITNPLSFLDLLYFLKIMLIIRNYKSNFAVFKVLATTCT